MSANASPAAIVHSHQSGADQYRLEHSEPTLAASAQHPSRFNLSQSFSKLKQTWLHLNGDDPSVANMGLWLLLSILFAAGVSYYVSFLDGFFRAFWRVATLGAW